MEHPALIFFSPAHPMFENITFEFVEVKPETLSVKVTAGDLFVHQTEENTLHSGFCTLVLDSIMGGSVMGCMDKLQPIATVNLNTQHSRRPVAGNTLLCTANVQRIEQDVAVVNGQIICFETKQIYSTANGSFMIGTRSTPLSRQQA